MKRWSFLWAAFAMAAMVLALGSCSEGNIDSDDDADSGKTPEEPVVYKVGDPYVVNGNTVGIVYEVDETGTHGKAYSLTVYNLSDMHFCIKEGTEGEIVPGVPQAGTMIFPTPIEDDAMPESTTDGAANCQKMKNETDWQNRMLALKWVEDLAAAQGVAWYIPAIDELKELFEYMSGTEFTQVTWTSGSNEEFTMEQAIPLENEDAVKAAWTEVRNTYAKYAEGQYVVFEPYVTDDSDSNGDHQDLVQDPWKEIGDNYAYRWLSSTVGEGKKGTTSLYYISMYGETTTYPFPVVDSNMDSSMASQSVNYETQAGSIHPICKF